MSEAADRGAEREPLRESAPLAYALAAKVCRIDQATRESCAWYHGLWALLRLLGIGTTPTGVSGFLAETLYQLAADGGYRRVLIAGAADYGLAAHVIAAYRRAHAPLALSVVDRCATPLALNRWYAARVGAAIEDIRDDLVAHRPALDYDVILSHSVLGYFSLRDRSRLFEAWATQLRHGGRIVLTNRIRPGHGSEPVRFTPAQAAAFCATIGTAAAAGDLPVPAHANAWAAAYARNFASYAVETPDDLVASLTAAGFGVDRVETSDGTPSALRFGLSGPTLADAAEYVRLVATRR
jgi:SAM-dependent methyltransferase